MQKKHILATICIIVITIVVMLIAMSVTATADDEEKPTPSANPTPEIVELTAEERKQISVDIIKTNLSQNDIDMLAKLIYGDNIQPGVIVVDPPRKGLDNTTIENMLKIKPERIVYISCNPATLVRDLAKIEEKYHIEKIQPVDMFPFTSHVECVVVLQQKK